VSVVLLVGRGCANLATANNSCLSLYKPTVVTYGLKYEPVTKSYTVPSVEPDIKAAVEPDINDGFKLKLNSSGLIVHLN
jgi:hypothetical protein